MTLRRLTGTNVIESPAWPLSSGGLSRVCQLLADARNAVISRRVVRSYGVPDLRARFSCLLAGTGGNRHGMPATPLRLSRPRRGRFGRG